MNIIVQKYGGTSVENKEKLKRICNRIIQYKEKNNKMVIVVSAMGKETDHLIQKAKNYSKEPSKRELDLLLSTGELQTVALLSMMLNERGHKCVGLTGAQAGILSDSTYGNATIKSVYTNNILNYLNEDYIVVVAGFQASDRFGNVTTLGRGGSDLSAVAIASALNAKKCEIYSDIDGVFSADPKIITRAKLLKKILYNEMLEAASAGAKVLHNRSVHMGKKNSMPIYVKNSGNNSKGTIVTNTSSHKSRGSFSKEEDFENYKVKFITKKDDISKISIIGDMVMTNKDTVHKIFDLASKENITIYMITFSELSLNLIVDKKVAENFMKKLHYELIEKENENIK